MYQLELMYVSKDKNYYNFMMCKGQRALLTQLEKLNAFSSKFYEDFFKNI